MMASLSFSGSSAVRIRPSSLRSARPAPSGRASANHSVTEAPRRASGRDLPAHRLTARRHRRPPGDPAHAATRPCPYQPRPRPGRTRPGNQDPARARIHPRPGISPHDPSHAQPGRTPQPAGPRRLPRATRPAPQALPGRAGNQLDSLGIMVKVIVLWQTVRTQAALNISAPADTHPTPPTWPGLPRSATPDQPRWPVPDHQPTTHHRTPAATNRLTQDPVLRAPSSTARRRWPLSSQDRPPTLSRHQRLRR